MQSSYDYAVVRVVPFPQREEFFNAGVILFCAQQKYLDARVSLDVSKLAVLAPESDAAELQQRLGAISKVCAGDPDAGPIAQLSQRARFHWLVAPRSTVIQVSPVHSGICDDPAEALENLYGEQVLR